MVATACALLALGSEVHAQQQGPQAVAAQPGNRGMGWFANPVMQTNGSILTIPDGTKRRFSRYNNLAITVDTRWANNYGYRPVKVTITSPQADPADRVITVQLHSGINGTVSTEQSFVLPAGRLSQTTTITVPQYQSSTQNMWWDVWVDGVKDKDMTLDKTYGGAWASIGAGASFLVPGPANTARNLFGTQAGNVEVMTLPLNEFPQQWIDYSSFDVVALPLDQLQTLVKQHPAAFESLRRWAHAGGQVWIGTVGKELEEIKAVSKLFHLNESVAPSAGEKRTANTVADDEVEFGWKPVRFNEGIPIGTVVTFVDIRTGQTRTARDPQDIARLRNDGNFSVINTADEEVQAGEAAPITALDTNAEPSRGRRRRFEVRSSAEWFLEQKIGLGKVRVFRESALITEFPLRNNANLGANPVANEDGFEQMPLSLSSAMRATARWNQRHGLAPDDANFDFANLLVPGVGMAPVTEFEVLITLFVLLIGPVNYWLLKRWGRLHLLVLTVPLAAGLATLGLFGYAVISDGFSTTVRAHSFTTLDQRTGEAACWTRLSYYAGVTPSQGLVMPADVALYPVIPGWNETSVDATLGIERDLVWNGEEQDLTRGWLRARKPTQYLTVRARKSPYRLELEKGGGKMRANNKLGASIQFVLAIDDEGQMHAGENLADGKIAFLTPIERTDAVRRLRKITSDNEPLPPAELADGNAHFNRLQRRQRRQLYMNAYNINYSEAKLSDGLTKGIMNDLLGLGTGTALQLPPRSYLAITETGPEVEIGLEGTQQVGSFHVVLGQY